MHRHGFGRGGFFEAERGGPFPQRLRRARLFDSSELQLVVLDLMSGQSRHGYELIREIEAQSGGLYAPSPGMIYPTLSMLLELGLIEEVEAEGARKSFALTDAGRAHLAGNESLLAELRARLASLADAKDRVDPAPLRRAIGNLRQVLSTASGKPGFDENKVLDAARMIDEVAGKIERM